MKIKEISKENTNKLRIIFVTYLNLLEKYILTKNNSERRINLQLT
jgi:hypothetical protein